LPQSGLAARCVGARIGSPIAQENNRGFADKEKAPWSEGRIGAKPASIGDSVWLHRKNTNEREDGLFKTAHFLRPTFPPLQGQRRSISAMTCAQPIEFASVSSGLHTRCEIRTLKKLRGSRKPRSLLNIGRHFIQLCDQAADALVFPLATALSLARAPLFCHGRVQLLLGRRADANDCRYRRSYCLLTTEPRW